MKAAILNNYGQIPTCKDYPEPTLNNPNQIMVRPLVSSVKQLDIIKAKGKHYTKFSKIPEIMGMDGVAQLDDGRCVYSMGITGMMAEKAIIDKRTMIPLPNNLDKNIAAALPNMLIGSDIPLKIKAGIKEGTVVLINGATGLTGSLAVQMAKFHGAGKIIVTGRNAAKLDHLKSLGADVAIRIDEDDNSVIQQIVDTYKQSPFSVILDYLWGHSAELILEAIRKVRPKEGIKFISIGSLAGENISLPSQLLRSSDLTIMGSGIGSFSGSVIKKYLKEDLTKIFNYAASNPFEVKLKEFKLNEVSEAWEYGPSIIKIQSEYPVNS